MAPPPKTSRVTVTGVALPVAASTVRHVAKAVSPVVVANNQNPAVEPVGDDPTQRREQPDR